MPDDGAVSASRATAVAAGTHSDAFNFAPLMAEGERLIWQGQPRPMWRELWRGNIKGALFGHALHVSFWVVISFLFVRNAYQSEDLVFMAVGAVFLGGGFIVGIGGVWRSILMRDRLRYAVTSRQLLVGMAGRTDCFAQLQLYMVKELTLLEEADGSGTIMFHREENEDSKGLETQSDVEAQIGLVNGGNLKKSIPRFALIDDVRAVHDLIERERVRIQDYWRRADAME